MKSLSVRLTAWYALVVSLTVISLLLVGRSYLERNLVSGIDLLNEVEFEEVRARIENINNKVSQDKLIAAIKSHAEMDAALFFFQVSDGYKNVLYKSSNLGPYQLPEAVHGHPRVTVKSEKIGWLRSMEIQYAGLDIHVVSSLNSAEALFDNYNRTSFFVAGGAFVLSLFIGYLLSRFAIRPIALIQESAQRVTASSFNERIPVPNTGDEIERMAILLNDMLDRLETSYNAVKRFTAEASHEFRTPLSIIRLQTERLLAHPDLPVKERTHALHEQMEEVEHLSKIIDSLLLLAKVDAGAISLSLQPVNLQNFLDDFESDAALLASEHSVKFKLDARFNQNWIMDVRWIRQVLLNLMSNALAVSPPNSTIQLSASAEDDRLYLRVIDEGPGLKTSELEKIFDRFERLDNSAGSKSSGLGLAICRSIVRRHHGKICAYNRSDRKGLVVEVCLPRQSTNADLG